MTAESLSSRCCSADLTGLYMRVLRTTAAERADSCYSAPPVLASAFPTSLQISDVWKRSSPEVLPWPGFRAGTWSNLKNALGQVRASKVQRLLELVFVTDQSMSSCDLRSVFRSTVGQYEDHTCTNGPCSTIISIQCKHRTTCASVRQQLCLQGYFSF